jgi:hypothetical protein
MLVTSPPLQMHCVCCVCCVYGTKSLVLQRIRRTHLVKIGGISIVSAVSGLTFDQWPQSSQNDRPALIFGDFKKGQAGHSCRAEAPPPPLQFADHGIQAAAIDADTPGHPGRLTEQPHPFHSSRFARLPKTQPAPLPCHFGRAFDPLPPPPGAAVGKAFDFRTPGARAYVCTGHRRSSHGLGQLGRPAYWPSFAAIKDLLTS